MGGKVKFVGHVRNSDFINKNLYLKGRCWVRKEEEGQGRNV